MSPNTMTCKEFVRLVTDYLDHALDHARHDDFRRHLSVCKPCVHYLDQMRKTIRALGDLHADEEPSRRRVDGILARVLRG
jgi:hypothetical protein